MTYIAEDVPWYMIDKSIEAPWRDEDVAMSAPTAIHTGEDEEHARGKIAMHLLNVSEMDHVWRSGNPQMYVSAANFFLRGGDGLRISGRYYRIREV